MDELEQSETDEQTQRALQDFDPGNQHHAGVVMFGNGDVCAHGSGILPFRSRAVILEL